MDIFIWIVIILISLLYLIIHYDDSENYILLEGKKTEGIITSVQSHSQRDRYGKAHVRYTVSYQFRDLKEQIWRGKFTINSSVCRFKEEDKVKVYYLPDKPYKHTVSR